MFRRNRKILADRLTGKQLNEALRGFHWRVRASDQTRRAGRKEDGMGSFRPPVLPSLTAEPFGLSLLDAH
jgi:hypothetical protein